MDSSRSNTAIDVFRVARIMLLNIKIYCQYLKTMEYKKETKSKLLTFLKKQKIWQRWVPILTE